MSANVRLVLALLLPVLGITVGIVRGELHGRNAQRFVFDISGYDPRDLLRGHYLAYRVELHDEDTRARCSNDDPGCCLCLTARPEGAASRVERMACELARQTCAGFLPVEKLDRLQRFYIPEARANELTLKLQQAAARKAAQIVVAVDAQGVPRVERLLVDGVPIERASESP